jgi:hypothetical protein
MKLIDNLRESLDSSGVTNPSKLYTPFTLFCVYFAIYFKAEILGRIFLASDWKIIHSALTDLSSPSAIEWFTFASKVAAYSLGMILLYGLAQAGAVLIWGLSNRLNTWISAKAEAGKYVARSELNSAERKLFDLYDRERELTMKIDSYHDWTPERIRSLSEESSSLKIEIQEEKSEKSLLLDNLKNLTTSNEKISNELTSAQSSIIREKNKATELEKKVDITKVQLDYEKGLNKANSIIFKYDRLKFENLEPILDDLRIKDFFIGLITNITKKMTFEDSEIKIQHGQIIAILSYLKIGKNSSSLSDSFKVNFSLSPMEIHRIRTILKLT